MAAVVSTNGEAPGAREFEKVWTRQYSEVSTTATTTGADGSDRESETDDIAESEPTFETAQHGAGAKDVRGAGEGAAFLIAMLTLAVGLALRSARLPPSLVGSLCGLVALEGAVLAYAPATAARGWAGCALVPLYLCCCAIFLACQTPQL